VLKHDLPMNMRKPSTEGFTRIEGAFIGVVIVLLMAVAIPTIRHHNRSGETECFYNLRCIGMCYGQFISERGAPVTSTPTNEGGTKELTADPAAASAHFVALMTNSGSLSLLACPLDVHPRCRYDEPFNNNNLSYFITLTAAEHTPNWLIAGTRNISHRQAAIIPLSATVMNSWHDGFRMHGARGYTVHMDGHVESVGVDRLPYTFREGETNNIIVP